MILPLPERATPHVAAVSYKSFYDPELMIAAFPRPEFLASVS